MATVSKVIFPAPETDPNKPSYVKVKVDYTVAWEPAELGKPHRIAVQLVGEDKAGDEETPLPFQAPQVLYTFLNGLWPYTVVTPTGTYSNSVQASLPRDKLNEDPGFWVKQIDINTAIQVPYPDEVYARVTVSRVSDGRSATLTLL